MAAKIDTNEKEINKRFDLIIIVTPLYGSVPQIAAFFDVAGPARKKPACCGHAGLGKFSAGSNYGRRPPKIITCNPVTADMIDRLDERLTPDASSKCFV
jgi:hypothetical protein